jgi:thiol-disulfide isomerase/thioredoxin
MILDKLLSYLEIHRQEFLFQFNSHPNYPSASAFSDTLNFMGVRNDAYELERIGSLVLHKVCNVVNMKKIVKYFFIFYSTVVFSQNTTVLYKIKKTCGDVSIGMGVGIDKKYFENHTLSLQNKKEYSDNGEFILDVDHEFPLPYSLSCIKNNGNFKVSYPFLVSKESLNFKLDSIGLFVQPLPVKNNNSIIIKDQYKFNASFSTLFNDFFDKSNKENNLKIDYLLVKYSKENPNSYMLFWTLVQQFQMKGFKESYIKSFENLSLKIRNSKYGKLFYIDMMNSLKLSENLKFPEFEFQNKKISSSFGKKYTLIDFWFSHCGPCLNDFPKYKEVYAKYKEKGFEIIGVSTDRTKDIADWGKVIKEKDLDWIHLLDENGTESHQFNINAFPTTFLLNSEGIIIKKDISPEELDEFLEQNLK